MKPLVRKQDSFHFADDFTHATFRHSISETNVKLGTVLPIIHQHQQELVLYTEFRRLASAGVLTMSSFVVRHCVHHLCKDFFTNSGASLKGGSRQLLNLFPMHK